MTVKNYPHIGETVCSEKLENGLQVHVVEKPEFAECYAFFATNYGGMDTRFALDGNWQDTPAGIAHYLEHKLFDTEEGNALQDLACNGASPNAYTSNDITAYHFSCTEHFVENLKILLSFVSVPYFTDESVEKEQGIIGQEIGMIEDNPGWQLYKRLLQGMYQENPIRTSIAGTVESISHITAETLYHCHKAFYTASNMVLTVVGNVKAQEVMDIAREVVPGDTGVTITRDHGREPVEVGQKEMSMEMEVSMPQFLLGYKCQGGQYVSEYLRTFWMGLLVSELLFGDSSPFYLRMYEQGHINAGFDGEYESLAGVAFYCIGGSVKDPHYVVDEIKKEVQRVLAEGIEEDFYQRVRKACYGDAIGSLNSVEHIACVLAEGHFYDVDLLEFPAVFESITKEDILHFIQENFKEEYTTLSLILPKQAEHQKGI